MSKQDQIAAQQQAIGKDFISPLKAVFPWTKDKEIASAKLYDLLQRALSPDNHYFSANESKFKNTAIAQDEITKLFTNYVVIDKYRIPENFLKLFHLDLRDPDIEEKVIRLFQKARSLKDKTWRILFIEDKIIVFRTEERLVHEYHNLTQWEKKRSQKVTKFNTFSNIYDAIRSQYYIIENSQNKQLACEEDQKEALSLAQDLREQWIVAIKDWEWQRKLDAIIEDIERATNYRVLGACLYNLQNLTFKNPSIDANLLMGGANKLKKRFDDLQKIVGVVSYQLEDLESRLQEYENHLEMFLTQLSFANKEFALDNYFLEYRNIHSRYWDISPFCEFHKRLQNDRANKKPYDKTCDLITNVFGKYRAEHKSKLSWETTLSSPSFDEFKDMLNSFRS